MHTMITSGSILYLFRMIWKKLFNMCHLSCVNTFNHKYCPQHTINWERFLSKLFWGEILQTPIISFYWMWILVMVTRMAGKWIVPDNIEKLTIKLYVFIISTILAKFQEDQRSIAMSSIKYLNFKFLWSNLCLKNKFIDQIVNNIWFNIKFDMYVKNIKEIQSNS